MVTRHAVVAIVAGLCGACLLVEPFPDLRMQAASSSGSQADAGEDRDARATECAADATRACVDTSGLCAGAEVCTAAGSWGVCSAKAASVERCDTPDDENCDGTGACTGAPLSVIQLGDGLMQQGLGIASDDLGNALVVGNYEGSLTIPGRAALDQKGTGALDGFLLKVTRSGEVAWAKSLTDGALVAVATSPTMIAVAGYIDGPSALDGCPALAYSGAGNRDILVATLAHDGTCLAARTFGPAGTGEQDEATAIAIHRGTGSVVVGGLFVGTLALGGAGQPLSGPLLRSAFIARFDDKLTAMHALAVTNTGGRMTPRAVAIHPSGDAVLFGDFVGPIDIGGVSKTSLGQDIFLLGMDGNGVAKARFATAAPGDQHAVSAAFDSAGNLLVMGVFTPSFVSAGWANLTTPPGSTGRDIFLVKHQWPLSGFPFAILSERIGGVGDEGASAMALDGADNVVVVGSAVGEIDLGGGAAQSAGGNADVFLAKYRTPPVTGQALETLTHVWSTVLGDERPQWATAVATDPWGNLLVTGTFSGSIAFSGPGKPATTAAGGGATKSDVFFVRRAP